MGQFAMRRSFDAPADVVWDVVSDHALYGTVAPNLARVEVVDGAGEGMVRRCIDTGGNEWTETCRRWDEGRAFEMVVDVAGSDFHRRLFDRFEGSWSLEDREEDVLVTVAFEFEPKYGPLGWLLARYFRYKAPALVEPIFDGWAAAVEARGGRWSGARSERGARSECGARSGSGGGSGGRAGRPRRGGGLTTRDVSRTTLQSRSTPLPPSPRRRPLDSLAATPLRCTK